MSKTERIIGIALMLILVFTSVAALAGDVSDVSDKVVRIHVIANSDSDMDQECKLNVRDAIIKYAADTFPKDASKSDTIKYIEKNMKKIEMIAQETIDKFGLEYGAKVSIVEMDFDKKEYEDITMPAGKYDAIRVVIGEGKGKNWWCVMYPPLCVPMATDDPMKVFSERETDMLHNSQNYEIKFALLELFDNIGRAFSDGR